MNLSSKEVAHLIGISVHGLEISRYRLRKKLQLAPETTRSCSCLIVKMARAKTGLGNAPDEPVGII